MRLHLQLTLGGRKRLVVDNTSLVKLRCPRMYYYAHVLEYVPAEESLALEFGRAMHEALATRYRVAGTGELTDSVRQAMELVVPSSRLPEDQDPRYSRNALLGLIRSYNETYPREPWAEILAVERSFQLPFAEVGGTTVDYAGRIDLLVRMQDGSFWVLDHKTTSFFGDSILNGWSMDGAMIGYAWAALALGLAKKVRGFIINAMRPGEEPEFRRYSFEFPPGAVEDWEENTLQLCRLLLQMYDSDEWPMQRACCVGRYGTCEYLPVCSATPTLRNGVLQNGEYIKRVWNP